MGIKTWPEVPYKQTHKTEPQKDAGENITSKAMVMSTNIIDKYARNEPLSYDDSC